MRSQLIYLCILLFVIDLSSQTSLQVERSVSSGTDRNLGLLHNLDNGTLGSVGLKLQAGTDANLGYGGITQTNLSYTAIPDWKGYLSIYSGQTESPTGNGINLAATEGDAKIRFYTNGVQPSNLRLIVLADGNVGVGAPDPQERLQVANGDIYLSDVNSGVIMRSPDGTCYRMTVQDGGTPLFTALGACP